jgi:hypothetical protein
MAHFTKSGQRLYTAEQVQAYFNASFWSEYNQTTEDDSKTGAGGRWSGFAQFHLGGERISSKASFRHLSAEEMNERAKDKNKPLDKVRAYIGGHSNDRTMAKQNVDFMERLDSMQIGDGSTSHDQAFDNRETA